jgi:RNA polymerase sigma factor (TIGR02999 family)
MAHERADHTLQATALVHEAYMRLMRRAARNVAWECRAHFFAAAAEAMRRILIEHARMKNAAKRGGGQVRGNFDEIAQRASKANGSAVDILALDEALTQLESQAPDKARLVSLRFFAGLSLEEAATALNISERTAKRHWVVAKAILYKALAGQ